MMRVHSECEKQFYKNNTKNLIFTLIALVLVAFLNIALAFMLQYFIEAVEYNSGDLLQKGINLGTIYLVVYWIFSILKRNYKNAYMKKAISQFKDYIFHRMLHKSIAQFGAGESSKFISAFSNDLNSIEVNYLSGSLDLILTTLMFGSAVVAMLYMQWSLAVPVILFSLICCFVTIKYGERLVVKEKETSEENMGFIAQVKDLLNGFIVIKSFKAENEVLDIFRKKNVTLEATKQGRRVTSDTVSIFGDISSILVNSLIMGMGIYFAFQGYMSIGKVIAFFELGNYLLVPVRNLGTQISNRKAAIKLIDRLAKTIEVAEDQKPGNKVNSFDSSIELKVVSFSYEGDKEVLQHVNIKFEKGKSYAIVGGSGSGKSTIFKLLLGYHDNYSGEVLFDGQSMKEIDLDSLYGLVSTIQQDVFLFDSTIRNNITMFREFDEEKVNQAIEKAGLAGLIQEKGEDYSCGEGGKNLSGGEKQRVSIARCLVREAPVLLMDEVTAALDNETSYMVEGKILEMKDVTKIIITHRLNEDIMKRYDQIFVMNKGCIIESGTFDELMKKQKYFYSFYNVVEAES